MTHLHYPKISIIAAVDSEHGIGRSNTIPWHIPEDLQHFKQLTEDHTVIMGRRTYESIGHPLPRRRNIVVSRDDAYYDSRVDQAKSLWAAVESCKGQQTVWVIGGWQMYLESMSHASRIVITRVLGKFGCDRFFPAISNNWWLKHATPILDSVTGERYHIQTYER